MCFDYDFSFLESILPTQLPACRSRKNVSGVDIEYCKSKGMNEFGYYINKEKIKGSNGKSYTKRTIDHANKCESITFGLARQIFSKKGLLDQAYMNKIYPIVYQELKLLMKSIDKDFKYDCICLNHNLKCLEHKDKLNCGASYIVGFGDYKGGTLKVEDCDFDIKYNPLFFNGAELKHKTNDFTGDRWTAIFFNKYDL